MTPLRILTRTVDLIWSLVAPYLPLPFSLGPPTRPQYFSREELEHRAHITGALSRYSTDGMPVLEDSIPDDELPDFLLVHDPHGATDWMARADDGAAIPYYRVKEPLRGLDTTAPASIPSDDATRARTAHLYLHAKNMLGRGHHAWVYRAPLSRRGDAKPSVVAAKLGEGNCEALRMLANEAAIYSLFPQDLKEDSPAGPAVVPKFYGYYLPLPILPEMHRLMVLHSKLCANSEEDCGIWSPAPILLVEECGRALGKVECESMTPEHQQQCSEMLGRFHAAGLVHQSIYGRNILVQPGPLDVPPEKRSADFPSFRMIDFGRTVAADSSRIANAKGVFHEWCRREQQALKEVWATGGDDERHTPKADHARKCLKALMQRHLEDCSAIDQFLLKNGLVKY